MEMKLKVDNGTMLVWFGISVFAFNSVFRSSFYIGTGISLPGMLSSVNWLALFCFAVIITRYITQPIQKRQSVAVLFLCISLYLIITLKANSTSKVGQYVVLASIIPGMLLLLPHYDGTNIKTVYSRFLKFINFIFSAFFIIGIIDYFMGGVVCEFIAANLSDESWARMIRSEMRTYGFRIVTIIGSPLMNAYYALAMMVLNVCYEKVYGESVTNKYYIYAIGMLVVFLSGSRAALLFGCLFLLIAEMLQRYGFAKILLIFISFAILINTPIFQETVGNRLHLGFMNQSDARYQMLLQLQNSAFDTPHLLSGGGYNYSRVLTSSVAKASSNFEYPILMFLYDYGIVATMLYYVIYLLYPLLTFIKNRNGWFLFGYCILFGFMQTCNPIAQYYDFNLQFGFIIVLMTETARRMVNMKKLS